GCDMRPLITQEHRDRVAGYVDAGRQAGAQVVLDGRDVEPDGASGGYWLGPTLLDHVTTDMSVYRDEIFGPVLAVVRVETYGEALRLVNAGAYGNGTALFTRDGGAARRYQHDVEVGMVGINVPIPVPVAYHSFGGWKQSLFGDTHAYGTDGVHFYTRGKVVTSRWPEADVAGVNLGFPQNRCRSRLGRGGVRALDSLARRAPDLGQPFERRICLTDRGVDRPADREDRDGDDRPEQPREERPGCDTDGDDDRVQGHLPAHDQRLQDVPLDLADECDAQHHDHEVDEAAGRERDHTGDDHRQRRTDERDECADEHQHGERGRQRDADDRQQHERHDTVGEGHDGRSARVTGERVPAGGGREVGLGPVAGGKLVEEPQPHPLAAGEEEHGQEQAQRQDHEHDRHGAGVGDHLTGEVAGVLLDVGGGLADGVVDALVDLSLRDVERQRSTLEEVEDLLDAVLEPIGEIGPLSDHRGDHVREQAGDDEEGTEQRDEHGERSRHPPRQAADHRVEDGGDHQRQEHRGEDHLDPD